MYRLIYLLSFIISTSLAHGSIQDLPDYQIETHVNAKSLAFTEDELIAFQVEETLRLYPPLRQQKLRPIVKARISEKFDMLRRSNTTLILWNTLDDRSILGMAWLETATGISGQDAMLLRYAICTEKARYDRFMTDILSILSMMKSDKKYLQVKLPQARKDSRDLKPIIDPMLVDDEFLGKQGIEWLALQFAIPSN